MPAFFTHAIVGLAAAVAWTPRTAVRPPRGLWLLAPLCAAAPDLDVITMSLGHLPHGHMLGHRGLSHSLFFAAILALVVTGLLYRKQKVFSRGWWVLTGFFFAVTATHGLLDSMVDGALGTPYFAPFVNTRFEFPWRPIIVAPIRLSDLLSPWGLALVRNEGPWIWLPVWTLVALWRGTLALHGRRKLQES